MSGPLVSVVMPIFQQERYVAEALRSVLAQTYQPLEIIISDDCSTDRTLEIARDEAAAYRGPHRVVLHRNERNLGIENYNVLIKKAKGSFIVHAHGDDVSMPDRVERLLSFCQKTDVSLVAGNATVIDADGKKKGKLFQATQSFDVTVGGLAREGRCNAIVGATLGYERDVIERFGPLDRRRSALRTDYVLPFRAALLKGVALMPESLLSFRHHKSAAQIAARGDLEELATVESMAADGVGQLLYLIETIQQAHKLGLRPAELPPARRSLHKAFNELSMNWSVIRSRMRVEGWRCHWQRSA